MPRAPESDDRVIQVTFTSQLAKRIDAAIDWLTVTPAHPLIHDTIAIKSETFGLMHDDIGRHPSMVIGLESYRRAIGIPR